MVFSAFTIMLRGLRLGTGGQAEAWSAVVAFDHGFPALGLHVALKCFHNYSTFIRERDTLLTVLATVGRQRNLINVMSFDDAKAIIALPFMQGSAAKRLGSGPIRGADLKALIVGVLRGLIALHAAGFGHCDIKPDNILLDLQGTPVICDLGFAQRIGQRLLGGTKGYRPKEVLDRDIFEGFILAGNKPLLPFGAPRAIRQIAAVCFLDAGMRPTARNLLRFVRGLPASEF
ncbi:kinase-like domain-containing protein [Hyaloraphidium curvatum]|nr:kinase-like domain-containing protein [Hyaloraphidium curvatum]